jgi:hypothetical protein
MASFGDDEKWREQIVEQLLATGSTSSSITLNPLASLVLDLVKKCQASESAMENRRLRIVLQHVLADTNRAEAEKWVLFARKIEKTGES